jgi:hypothetical protein
VAFDAKVPIHRQGLESGGFWRSLVFIPTPDSIASIITFIVRWVKRGFEIFSATHVRVGAYVAIVHLICTLVAGNASDFTATRLNLAQYLALA